jgi:hypothetical protein
VFIYKIKGIIMSEKESPQIKDIAKFKQMREMMKGFRIIKNVFPFASPVLKFLGINTNEMKEAFEEFDKLEREFQELSELPDKFNDTFSSRGFIIFNSLNPDVAIEATRIAETDIDEGEKYLINHFTPEIVETYLYMMNGVKAFRPRMELAEKALIDYREERYHACIPVVLALMDGLVNELNRQQNRSFFSEDSDLRAWDCITSHEKGLNALKEVLHLGRYKTTTEEISIPYRNGILHGMDLGYANKTVAAKTWAALFAVRDWAEKAESKMLSAPPPEPTPTWSSLYQQVKEHSEWKNNWERLLENWKSRNITVGKDIPKEGEFTDFEDGTPEAKVVEFLCYWKKKNYGNMARCLESNFRTPVNKLAQQIRERYQQSPLVSFELIEVRDTTPAVSEVDVLLTYEKNEQVLEKTVEFRVLIYDEKNNPTIFGNSDAKWFIMNWILV